MDIPEGYVTIEVNRHWWIVKGDGVAFFGPPAVVKANLFQWKRRGIMDREESSVYYELLQIMKDLGFSVGYSELAGNDAVRVFRDGMDHETAVGVTTNKYNNTYD